MKHTALLLAGVLLSGQVFSGGDPESSNESTAPALSYENSSNSSSYQSEALDQNLTWITRSTIHGKDLTERSLPLMTRLIPIRLNP